MNKKIQQVINTLNKINFHNNDQISQQHLDMIDNTASINELYDKLSQEISKHSITKQYASNVLYKGFLQTENPNYLYKAAKLSDDFTFPALFTSSLTKLNEDQSISLKEYLKKGNKLDYQIAFKFFQNFELTGEVFDLFEDLIDDELAKPFKEAKQQLCIAQQMAQKTQTTIDVVSETGWFKGKKIQVKYDDAKLISNFEHKGVLGKLYAVLSKKFDLPKWESALDKGFANGSVGQNGVKILENKLFELKLNGGDRLYTSTIHKNTDGNYLAIFDKKGNHAQVSDALGNNKHFNVLEDCMSVELSGTDGSDG